MSSISHISISILGHSEILLSSPKQEENSSLQIDLHDEVVNANLHALFSRQPGTRYYLDETGKLKELIGFRKRFSFWKSNEAQAKVKRTIDGVLEKLDGYLQEQAVKPEAHAIHRFVIHNYFGPRGSIGRLSSHIYNHLHHSKQGLSYFLLPENTVRIQVEENRYLVFRSDNFKGYTLPLLLSLKDMAESEKHNLWSLLNRKKGEIFWIKAEDGACLKKVSGCERLRYLFDRKAHEDKVQGVIHTTFEALNRSLGTAFHDETTRNIYRTVFSHFFSAEGSLGRLSKRVFHLESFDKATALGWSMLPNNSVWIKAGEGRYLAFTSEKLEKNYLQILSPIDLSVGDNNEQEFFFRFLQRKRGMRFYLNETGGLEEVKGIQKWFFYWKNRKALQEGLKSKMDAIPALLNTKLDTISADDEALYQTIVASFFQREGSFARLTPKIYDRAHLDQKTSIEKLLDPELAMKKEFFKVALFQLQNNPRDPALRRKAAEACMDLVFEEMTFVHSLGIPLKKITSGGSGGARFAYDRFGNIILVVKPGDEGPHGENNPQWYAGIKQLFVSQSSCLKGNSEPLAEVLSYVIGNTCGLDVVPPTDLRFVESKGFNGHHFKECSVQMFVKGASSLREYLEIPHWMESLPRWFLRWYFAGLEEEKKKTLPQFLQTFLEDLRNHLGGVQKEQTIREKIPEEHVLPLFETMGIHNFLIEDIDCHLENMLFLSTTQEKTADQTPSERLFSSSENLTEEEIGQFVDTFFSADHFQQFLRQLLSSVEFDINETETRKVTLIKHDGGSSNPHHHPSGYLSTRFKHLFEVFPHFRQPFSKNVKTSFTHEVKKEDFMKALSEKTYMELRKLMESLLGYDTFPEFWTTNQDWFELWIGAEEKERKLLEADLVNYEKLRLKPSEKKHVHRVLPHVVKL